MVWWGEAMLLWRRRCWWRVCRVRGMWNARARRTSRAVADNPPKTNKLRRAPRRARARTRAAAAPAGALHQRAHDGGKAVVERFFVVRACAVRAGAEKTDDDGRVLNPNTPHPPKKKSRYSAASTASPTPSRRARRRSRSGGAFCTPSHYLARRRR